MKKNIIIILLSLFLVSTVIYIVTLQNKTTNYNTDIKEKLNNNTIEEVKEYNCTFTQTYKVVNLLDGYLAEVPELSYVILDKYQSHNAISHIIPTNLKSTLESNKYYEFTYQIKGKENIKDMNDIYKLISSTELYNKSEDKDKELFVYLTIKETDKTGIDQINEDICK